MRVFISASRTAATLATLALALDGCANDGPANTLDDISVKKGALTGLTFAVADQQTYEGSYEASFSYADENGYEFGDRFDNNNTWSWWYDTTDKKLFWEDSYDQTSVGNDSVPLLFSYTHGGITGTGTGSKAIWSMWNSWTRAESTAMRLGDEAGQLAAWFNWSCHTLQSYDGYFIDRWWNAFAGGLVMVMGSHDIVWDGWTTSDVGEQVAENLNDGDLLDHAWTDGLGDVWVDNDGAVASTGTNYSDCYARIANARWPGVASFTKLTQSTIGYMCGYEWSDL